MSTAPSIQASSKAERRRLVVIGLLRSSVTAIVLIAAYYLLPLDRLAGVSLAVSLAVGLAALTGIAAYQVRAIIRHRHSAIRAVEALAVTVPLFLLLFAATYFLMAQANTDNFNVHALTRTDSLYFTITVFATVGFGDISATSQVARIAVMAQMILDLLVLGLLVKVFLNAVQLGREQQAPQQETEPPSSQRPVGPAGRPAHGSNRSRRTRGAAARVLPGSERAPRARRAARGVRGGPQRRRRGPRGPSGR